MSFLEAMRNRANMSRNIDFETISDEDFTVMCPITKDQFEDLFTFCDPVPEETQGSRRYRYVTRRNLLMFLIKLKQGINDDFLKVMFGMSTRQNVSLTIATVWKSLLIRFVPQNIGLNAITREEYIRQHVTPFSNALYNPDPSTPQAITLIDATYAYMGKSSCFEALRKSFSVHKSRHLVKPVLLVAPNGYILDIEGPYFVNAANNDAAILNRELRRDEELLGQWFMPGDIVLVDRGYRDSVKMLEERGVIVKMPHLLEPGQKQLTTRQANESRLVTKLRWIVESRNGHLKSACKLLDGMIQITHINHVGDFYRIAGALFNRYRPRILMEDATPELALAMLERVDDVNLVQERVIRENLHTRNAQRWVQLDSTHVTDFPRLSMVQLKELTVGTYQLSLSPSYIQDRLSRESTEVFELEMMRDVDRSPIPGLIRVRSYSRFRNATRNADDEIENNEAADGNGINEYYCTCIAGARTIGACSHITAVIWFLSFARHEELVKYPSTSLTQVILDVANMG